MARLFKTDVTLELLNRESRLTAIEHLGIVITEIGEDFLRATMPVDERTCQPTRILHGGVSVVLAETLASVGANALVDRTRMLCVGQEINANHLRSAPVGSAVIGTARPFHVGARSQVWGVEIVDSAGRRVCVSRVTMAVIRLPQP
jgi:1,4-dihydroxy-2-naphthoyl-CoA hydrolase